MSAISLVLVLGLSPSSLPEPGIKLASGTDGDAGSCVRAFLQRPVSFFLASAKAWEPRCAGIYLHGNTVLPDEVIRECLHFGPARRITLGCWLRSQASLEAFYAGFALVPLKSRPLLLPASVSYSSGMLWVDFAVHVPF